MSALDDILLTALEVLVVITVLVGLTWAADRFLARRRPALGASMWLAALVGVLVMPAFVLCGRQLPWRVAVFQTTEAAKATPGSGLTETRPTEGLPAARSSIEVVAQPLSPKSPQPRDSAPPSTGAALNPAQSSEPNIANASALSPVELAAVPDALPVASSRHSFAAIVLLVWALGSVYLIGRLLHGVLRVRRLWRRLRPLDGALWANELQSASSVLSVARLPQIYLSPDIHSPLVAGLFPPRVILPEMLLKRGDSPQFVAVLVHECAHVLRRDPWVRLLQRLAAALFWVHPLVHLLNRRLDHAREEVCDNHVLAFTDAPSYAETLLTIARLCYPTPRLEGYLTMMPRHYPLEHRVAELLEERRDRATCLPRAQRAALCMTLLLMLMAAASVGFSGATASPIEEPSAKTDKSSEKPAGEKLTGEVFLADGKSAAGAIVWAAQYSHSPLIRREVVADDKGRYSLSLTPGQWWVWGRRGSQGGQAETPRGIVDITAGRTNRPIPIRLEERGTLRGRLLEAETGKPIPGGKLCLDNAVVLTADAQGKFEVGGLTRTHHESFVVAPGRMRLRVLFDTTAEADTELDVTVPRGGKIVGRVTDFEGKPIPGAHVGRSTSGSFFSTNALYVACDNNGRFEYDDAVSADQPTRLTAGAPGYAEDQQSGKAAAPDKPLELNFRLRPKPGTPAAARVPDAEIRRTVSGVVHGPDGKPVAGVVVRWGYEPYVGATETKTDAAGRFRFEVPDKKRMLAVLPKAFLPEFPTVAAGGDKEVKVTLREGRIGMGRVIDDRGKPIRDIRVVAVIPSPDPSIGNPYWLSESSASTDADGKFEVKGAPSDARFDFMKPGLSEVRNRELDLNRADNSVVMVFGGALSGRVVDRDGKPIRSFRVLVNFPRERKPNDATSGFFAGYTGIGVRFTSADGSFVLTGIGAGSVYRVTALADGHGEATVDRMLALPANHVRNAKPTVLKAGPPVKLRVRAVTGESKPIADARVTLVNGEPGLDTSFMWGYHDASWEDMSRGRTGADGWGDFPALAFGEATVLVRAPGYARHRVGWRDKAKDVTCELAKEAVVTGEALDAAGKPLKDFYVQLMNGGDQISVGVGADEKGRFRVEELPAGAWTVTIRGGEYGRLTLHQETVNLKAGETKEMKIKAKKQ